MDWILCEEVEIGAQDGVVPGVVPGASASITPGVEASDQSGGCGWIDGFAIRVDPGDVVIAKEIEGVCGVDVVGDGVVGGV